eukprot:189741-Karenia_brevis.AAC.1
MEEFDREIAACSLPDAPVDDEFRYWPPSPQSSYQETLSPVGGYASSGYQALPDHCQKNKQGEK